MNKLLLIISIGLFFTLKLKAQQQPVKQYMVEINNSTSFAPKAMHSLLQRVTVADSVMVSTASKHRYLIYTKKELNQNIIDGKLQKNATPMGNFQFIGESDKDLLK